MQDLSIAPRLIMTEEARDSCLSVSIHCYHRVRRMILCALIYHLANGALADRCHELRDIVRHSPSPAYYCAALGLDCKNALISPRSSNTPSEFDNVLYRCYHQ